jgi:DNA-binding CsgD family transcriptional regulator
MPDAAYRVSSSPLLRGRDEVLHTLDRLCADIPAGGAVLLIVGEPGTGKTSLLQEAARRARSGGLRLVATGPGAGERNWALSGLQRLLWPLADHIPQLPTEGRAVVERVLAGDVPKERDMLAVSTAALELFTAAGRDRGLLLVVDDWDALDRQSGNVLAFVARRVAGPWELGAEDRRVGVVGACRPSGSAELIASGLPARRLGPLTDGSVRQLLTDRFPELPAQDHPDIASAADGNPLAAIELASGFTELTRKGLRTPGTGLQVELLPRSSRLWDAFAEAAHCLPDASRDAVLVAALHRGQETALVVAATQVLRSDPTVRQDVLEPAERAGVLIAAGPAVMFSHAVAAIAAVQRESAQRRRRAHAALAEVLPRHSDHHAWHRAQALTVTQHACAAAQLEASHRQAVDRGDPLQAVRMLQRAAELAASPQDQGRILIKASGLASELGRPGLVEQLLAAASAAPLTPVLRLRARLLQEASTHGLPGDSTELCDTIDPGDPDTSLSLLFDAAQRCWRENTGQEDRTRVVTALTTLSDTRYDPRHIATLATAEPVLLADEVAKRLGRPRSGLAGHADNLRLLGQAAHAIGDFERATDLLVPAIDLLRRQQRLVLLPRVLTMEANGAIWLGDWHRATAFLAEAHEVALNTHQPAWAAASRAKQALLAALRGEVEEAFVLAEQATLCRGDLRLNHVSTCTDIARGVACAIAGSYADAYAYLRPLFDDDAQLYHQRESFTVVMHLAEAAAHTGFHDESRRLLATWEQSAELTPAPVLHHQLAYARAVLAPDDHADDLFQAALNGNVTRYPLVRAMTQLAYGTWLRRRRRAAESRDPLRRAKAAFTAMGAVTRVRQVTAELRATGDRLPFAPGRGRPERTTGSGLLSPQETRIAELAAEGLTNREIGEKLRLSPRTIGSHLYRIFPKLDVTSRFQLRDRLEMDHQ